MNGRITYEPIIPTPLFLLLLAAFDVVALLLVILWILRRGQRPRNGIWDAMGVWMMTFVVLNPISWVILQVIFSIRVEGK